MCIVKSFGCSPLPLRVTSRCLFFTLVASVLLALAGCDRPHDDGRIVLKYWDKWNGFEKDAMQSIVDDYNASQTRVRVEFSSVSQINRKLMLATAGGVPPDVAGLFGEDVPVYAENNALTPLDGLAAKAGIKREDYIDIYWQMASHRGVLFALPSTPNVAALVWNKKMFREAGLDPEQPPRSIAELEAFNDKILRRRPDGGIEKIGHLPNEPTWNVSAWGYWFGAKFWDGDSKVEADSAAELATFRWLKSYPDRFGAQNLLALHDGFGSYASPQNPFLSGRVAMTLQGVWIYNFIKNYAPADFEWGVAAFPSVDPERLQNVATAGGDLLAIPAGSKHPAEAFEFLRYVNSQGPMEKLCLAQRKFTPLKRVSDDFFRRSPDPYVRKFVELANSANVHLSPRITTWNEYRDDLEDAYTRLLSGSLNVEQAAGGVQNREQTKYNRRFARWNRDSKKLTAEWAAGR